MAKPNSIELPDCKPIRILYEDRTVIAVDKPPGWMLVPDTWQRTARNLQAAITSSIVGGDFWAKSRGLKFLRYVHRLEADSSGVLLFAKTLRRRNIFSGTKDLKNGRAALLRRSNFQSPRSSAALPIENQSAYLTLQP